MVRGAKKEVVVGAESNPESDERRRLKKLALSKNILSETPATEFTALSPSKTVSKHHGRDVLRKSQRKNKFLFSFPGLLAPITGGKIGELKDLGTKNPILYLDFPLGQMKLFGTIVYPKNRYLTLQFSRGGKNVMCEDYFDIMIVFSDAWWIGRKDENPEEARLEFPKDLNEEQHAEFDFKGGAGGTSEEKQPVHKAKTQYVEQHSPKSEAEDDLLHGQHKVKDIIEVTPTRQSERTSGKRFNFAEVPSGDDSVNSDADTSDGEEKKVGVEHSMRNYSTGKRKNSCSKVLDADSEIASEDGHFSGQIQESTVSITKSTSLPSRNPSSLVQATISTLFKKVEEKKTPRNPKKSLSSKVSGQSLQYDDSKQKSDEVDAGRHSKKRNLVNEERKAGVESTRRKKKREDQDSVEPVKVYKRKTKGLDSSGPSEQASASSQVDEDSIEEFSGSSKDTDGSDEDWAA